MTNVEQLEARRLMAAGGLDQSFGGGDGNVVVKPTTRTYGINASDVAVDDQKRTVVAGLYRKHRQISLTRLNADGSTDTSFGSNGYATIKLPDTRSFPTFQIAADHSGRVLVLYGKTLHRLTASGKADIKFKGNQARADVPIVRETTDVFVDAQNNPLIVGTSTGKTGDRGTIVKLRRTGTLEATFGSGGAYHTPVPGTRSHARGQTLKVLPDGSIIGVADISPHVPRNGAEDGIYAFRLSRHGVVDPSYGTGAGSEDGLTKLFLRSDDLTTEYVSLAGIYDDGSLLLANTSLSGDMESHSRRHWTRLDVDGKVVQEHIDLPVSPSGKRPGGTEYELEIVSIQSDGKLLASLRGRLFRLNADYSFDTTFTVAPALDNLYLSRTSFVDRGDRLLILSNFFDATGVMDRSVFSTSLIEL